MGLFNLLPLRLTATTTPPLTPPQRGGEHTGAFDGLRLAAAFAVLFGHCYVLTGHKAHEPLARLTQGGTGIGEVAVYIFFAISGYLITQSWLRDPSVKRFMLRRLLRIIPALAFVIITSVFIVGATMTTLDLPTYFSQKETYTYLAKIFLYPSQHGLPAVFSNNPYPAIVNGSLWTLRVEFTLYMVIAGLGLLGLLRWRWITLGIALLCLIALFLITQSPVPFLHQGEVFLANAAPYFIGATMAQMELKKRGALLASIPLPLLTIASVGTPLFTPLLLISLPIVTILIAHFGRCDLSRFGDFSYGVYLWGFVMQQMIVALTPDITPLPLFALAATATLTMGALSWHLIEKPALKLKPRR